jgi:hypothetical protein
MPISEDQGLSLEITIPANDGAPVNCASFTVEGTVLPPQGTGSGDSTVTVTVQFIGQTTTPPVAGTPTQPSDVNNNWAFTFNVQLTARIVYALVTATATLQNGTLVTQQIWLMCSAGSPFPPPGPPAAPAAAPPVVLLTGLTLTAETFSAPQRRLRLEGTVTPAAAAISASAIDASLNQYNAFPAVPAPPAGGWAFDFFNVPSDLDLTLFVIGQSGTQIAGQALKVHRDAP